MGLEVLYKRGLVAFLAIMYLLACTDYAAGDRKPDDAPPNKLLDCRYHQSPTFSESTASSNTFPTDDLLRPLLADPKQPQFFAL